VPWRLILALLFMTAAIGPASAQDQRGGRLTETQERAANQGSQSDLFWNLLGLLGLIGLIGLLPQHEDDSYHPADID
jgi:hypothetical protein